MYIFLCIPTNPLDPLLAGVILKSISKVVDRMYGNYTFKSDIDTFLI